MNDTTLFWIRIIVTLALLLGIIWIWHDQFDWRATINSISPVKLKEKEQPERPTTGGLRASFKPYPDDCPPIGNTTFGVIIGNSVVESQKKPTVILKVDGVPLISVRFIGQELLLTCRLFDEKGQIVADIVDNEWTVEPGFKVVRSASTLIVTSPKGERILDLEFLHPRYLRLLGQFNFPNRRPLLLSRDGITYGVVTDTHGKWQTTSTAISIGKDDGEPAGYLITD